MSSLSIPNIKELVERLSFHTTAFRNKLIINHGAFSIVNTSNKDFYLHTLLPFVQNYSGCIFCDGMKFHTIGRLQLLNFSAESHFSQAKCYDDSMSTRWCDFRNVAITQTKLVFSFPFDYDFPSPFIVIGARAPPFDRTADRLYHEPIIVHSNLSQIPNVVHVKNISYLIGRFFNSMMLWHNVFDFLIPAYATFTRVEGRFENSERFVMLRDTEQTVFWELTQILSKYPIVNLIDDPSPRFFDRLIVGMIKFESDPNPKRGITRMNAFSYNFNETTASGFRDAAFRQLNVEMHPHNKTNPLVIYATRKGDRRDLTNNKQVLALMRKRCPFCVVKAIEFHHMSLSDQLQLMSGASALVGLHGSGLAHTIWMEPNTSALLEILPYGYWCRDWYHTAAKVARVRYFSTMNTGRLRPIPIDDENAKTLKSCLRWRSRCLTLRCHDILKETRFEMELDTFQTEWDKVVSFLDAQRQK